MTRLVLIRHGEAQSWVDGVVGGDRGCTGLSDRGRRQAAALRDRLARTGELGTVDALYASSLPRAIETADIIAPALGDPPVKVERDVREFDPGPEADGRTWEDVEREYPRELWDAFRPLVPGAESWATFGVRVGGALRDIASRHDGTVVVACHGGVIEQSVVSFFGLPNNGELSSFHILNTSITEWVRLGPDADTWRPAGDWRLLRLNDAAHLEGVDAG
jgi:probable phosphoglycerate mutase